MTAKRKKVAAVYELSPLQQGMFFHSRYGGEASVYLTQFHCRLRAALDRWAFRRAWERVVARHDVLRSSFHWKELDKPLQVVHREVSLRLAEVDLRHLAPGERERAFETFLAADRGRGMALERPPLMRLVLLRLGREDYRFSWSHHHLLLDGWSVPLVLGEVAACYRALLAGREVELPPARPFKDFVLWVKGRDLAAAKAYWRRLLAGFTAPNTFELARERRPEVGPEAYARVFRTLGAAARGRLEALGRSARVTTNTLFQAAWGLLLGRYSQQGDVVFGATTSGRPPEIPGVERMVGMFINTLPVRVRPDRSRPVAVWLGELQAEQARSRRHEHAPLAAIQSWSEVPAPTPLFESLLVFENLPALASPAGEGALGVSDGAFVQRTNYPLTLAVSPRGEKFSARIAFSPSRFEPAAIARMLAHLETLLAGMAARPEAPVGSLSPLGQAERSQILTEWCSSRPRRAGETPVHRRIAARAAAEPGALALLDRGREVSRGELWERAARLAGRLRGLGLGPEAVAAVCIDRSAGMLAAVLAVLEAGAAYLPLDPAYPVERLAFMLADSGAAAVLTEARHRPLFAGFTGPVVVVDGEGAVAEDAAGGPTGDGPADPGPASAAGLRQVAYIIYTSGSTGRPKGVMVEHRTLGERVSAMVELFGLGPADRQLQFVSLGFDVSCEEIFPPLVAGGSVVLEPGLASMAPAEVLALAGRRGATKMNLPASYWHQLVDEVESRGREIPESLRLLVTGAESPSPEKLARWLRLAGTGRRFFNVYGPTEATILATAEEVRLGPDAAARLERLAIGRPLEATAVYLLDQRLEPVMQPVVPGTAGELAIGGAGITRGYLGRPALTAERFVPDPFSGRAGARLYRSGDLARHLPDGRLLFAGRIDHQVKVRGFRVEPGEIEEALRRHPEVEEAVVLVRRDGGASPRLVAYAVTTAEPESEPTVGELRAFLAERLPEHMVPAAFVLLDALPLTANNKVDREALPEPGGDRPALEQEYVAPRTPLEEALAELWRELLGVERVGVRDSFFELGGDSLRGAIFINRLEALLGEAVYVVALFDSPTVEGFAAYLGGHCPAAVEKHFGPESVVAAEAPEEAGRMSAAELAALRELVVPLAPYPERGPRNPPAVFVLSPPRSGSTLLRVMLAGHPSVFAPPELDLLSFNTLAERRRAFEGRWEFWLEGNLRAVMELLGVGAEEARALVAGFEAEAMPTRTYYGWLQECLGGRLLVDKTPAYALDLEVLRRAERDFEGTRFVHLLRHPGGMIASFEKARIDELFFRYEHGHGPRRLGELVWNHCHRNILDFLAEIPAERQHRLRFEELVEAPEAVMRELAAFLGLELEAAMLEPYGDPGGRMTDGIHPLAKMLGDVKFHRHRAIDPEVARRWQETFPEDFLGVPTWALAAELGYGRPERWGGEGMLAPAASPAEPIPVLPRRGGERFLLSFAQRRLWVLDRLSAGAADYSMPLAVRLVGELRPARLAASLASLAARQEVLRTVFVEEDGRPWQRVNGPGPAPPELVDLGGLAAGDRDRVVRALAAAEAARPFDLERGPLLRLKILALGQEEHVLLATTHHIVSDGWSQGLLLRELAAGYAGAAPEPPPLQYADYAAWQRRTLGLERLGRGLALWKEHLAGAPTLLELPTDRPRPAVQSFAGGRRRLRLGAEETDVLVRTARAEGATLFMLLAAAFGTLLGRWSGQGSVLLGSPVANRERRELEELIGLFVNTVVLRVDTGGDPTFRELLSRVRESALFAFRHQDLPFEKLVEALQPERDTSHQPVFQAAFVLQGVPLEPLRVEGLAFEPLEVEATSAKFDLTLSLGRQGEGTGAQGALAGTLEYSADLFDVSTADRLAQQLERLLAAAAREPEARIRDLPLLGEAERRQLAAWAGTGTEPPAAGSLPELFAAAAARRGEATALELGGERMSYRELAARSRSLARRLRALGVGPEVRVGLLLERDFDLVVAILAVLEAGGAYVPLDPAYPAERRAYILEDAGVALLLAHAELAEELERKVFTLLLDRGEGLPPLTDHGPAPPVHPEQTAYAIYTSGSTGRPKGTLVSHGNVLALLAACRGLFDFGPEDVWTFFHSAAFDFSVWELWGALAHGGRLVLVPRELARAPEAFAELLAERSVTVLNQTPSAFRQLVATEAVRGRLAAPLRWVVFGGEALELGSLAPWWRAHGEERPRLINMYGITETTVHVTHRPLGPGDLETGWRSPIGRPLPHLSVQVLDPAGRPAPVGVPGELAVGGAGVSRSYLGRPALTASRFRPDPFSPRPGGRLYASGDLGRWLPGGREEGGEHGELESGDLEYLGRIDQQVKVRGFRIEPGEIEAVLAAHPAVAEAVVLARDFGPGDRRLAAFVVPSAAAAAPLCRAAALLHAGELVEDDLFELADGTAVAHLNPAETRFLDEEIFAAESYLRNGIGLGPGDVVFDVGANIGLFALRAARLGAVVHAFEPIPPVFEILERNLHLHGVEGGAHPLGLAEAAGRARFTFYPKVSVISGRHAEAAEEREVVRAYLREQMLAAGGSGEEDLEELLDARLAAEEVEAELATVSGVMAARGIERVDLLKVDVEKSELEVLLGVAAEDWPKIRQVVVEVHDVDGRLARVRSLLEGHGFRLAVEQDPKLRATGLWSVFARRPEAAPASSSPQPAPERAATWSSPRRLRAELRRLAAERLPEYMLPASFAFLPSLPLTANGKLDREALLELPAEGGALRRGESEPPRDDLERELASLFEALLALPAGAVGRSDDFFELGGHSLLAVRLVADLRARIGAEVALASLFREATVEALAALVREGESGSGSPLVRLQAGGGEGPALVCVHPAGGSVLCYRGLAAALGPGRPVLGLRAPGLSPGEEPLDRVEAMAERYLEALRAEEPSGPRALLGWSLGGLVAYEMARRLAGEGEEVALLSIIDVLARAPEGRREAGRAEMLAAALAGEVRIDPARLEGLGEEEQLARVLAEARRAGAVPEGFGPADARRYLAVYEAGRRAAAAYRPEPYPGPAILFRATDDPPGSALPTDLGWGELVKGGLEIHRIPGDHQSLLAPPGLEVLAAHLARALAPSSEEAGARLDLKV